MVGIERIGSGGRLGYNGGVEGRTIVGKKEGVGKAIRAETYWESAERWVRGV
jgi:hypothetical protein